VQVCVAVGALRRLLIPDLVPSPAFCGTKQDTPRARSGQVPQPTKCDRPTDQPTNQHMNQLSSMWLVKREIGSMRTNDNKEEAFTQFDSIRVRSGPWGTDRRKRSHPSVHHLTHSHCRPSVNAEKSACPSTDGMDKWMSGWISASHSVAIGPSREEREQDQERSLLPSACPSVNLSACPPVRLSICPSISPSASH